MSRVDELIREAEAIDKRLDLEDERERFLRESSKVEWQPATKSTRLRGMDRGRLTVSVELPIASRVRPKRTRRQAFPVTITGKDGKVRVVSGETYKPKRKSRKVRTSKNRKVAYRLSAQRVKGSGSTFDSEVMRKIGTIHQES
jgi:hypothetical protein